MQVDSPQIPAPPGVGLNETTYRGVHTSPIASPQSAHFQYARHPASHYRSTSGDGLRSSSTSARNSQIKSPTRSHFANSGHISPGISNSGYYRQPSPMTNGNGYTDNESKSRIDYSNEDGHGDGNVYVSENGHEQGNGYSANGHDSGYNIENGHGYPNNYTDDNGYVNGHNDYVDDGHDGYFGNRHEYVNNGNEYINRDENDYVNGSEHINGNNSFYGDDNNTYTNGTTYDHPSSSVQVNENNHNSYPVRDYTDNNPNNNNNNNTYLDDVNTIPSNVHPNLHTQTSYGELPLPRPNSDGSHFARPVSSTSSLSSHRRSNLIHADTDPLPLPSTVTSSSSGGHSRRVSSAMSLNDAASHIATASMYDLSQSYITPHFGAKSSTLMPRIQTIELYRKNAKRSNDPLIQFQFAQYMLQTALLSGSQQANSGSRQSAYGSDILSNAGGAPASSASSTTTGSSSSFTSPSENSATNTSNGTGTVTSGSGSLTPGIRGSVYSSKSFSVAMNPDEEKKIKRDLLKESVSILRKLSDRGFADGQYLLADALASGALGKPDLRESFSLFQLAAKHGHGEAAYRAALCLEQGWGTSKDIRRAAQFLRMAASRNQPGAMLRLGMACFYGRMGMSNTPQVKQEGIKWLKLAANEATEIFPQAPYELAKIVEVGYSDIVIPDQHWAVQLYVKSAELNYIPAARVLGKAYELANLGCPRDAALSIHYYTLGAIKGDPESMYSMCAWYMMGAEPILQKNEEEAYEWALRAANAGHPKAQFAVGYFLEHGTGVERDILQSSFWYHKAAEGGNENAIARLEKEKSLKNQNSKKNAKDNKDKECIIS